MTISTRSIFVVDDDQGTRDTYRIALHLEGFTVVVASSFSSAVGTLAARDDLHAMFLDLDLGDGTGLDVLRWMRERKRFVPTAVMTAFRPEFNPDDAIELGALAYVDQPLPIEVLVTLARGLTRPLSAFDDPNQLHCRFLAGDPGALDCLDAIFLKVLPRRLHRAFTRAPFDFAEDAVATACVEYGGRAAARYDPSRLPSVLDFVYAIAWRNLANRLHSEVARTNRERRWATESPVAQLPDSEGVAGAFDARRQSSR